jgi:hypothetical protein
MHNFGPSQQFPHSIILAIFKQVEREIRMSSSRKPFPAPNSFPASGQEGARLFLQRGSASLH